MGVTSSSSTGSFLLCNLFNIEALAPRVYTKLTNIKKTTNNLSDLKNYFDTTYPDETKLLVQASSGEARQGLRTLGEALQRFVYKHSMPTAIAQALAIYILMADEGHQKSALVQVFFEAYLRLRDVEVQQFFDSCKDGMDLDTLQLLQGLETTEELWTSPGVSRPNALSNPNTFREEVQQLWIALANILCKQPGDLTALRKKCEDIIHLSSDLFRSAQRRPGQDLATAAAKWKQVWNDLKTEAQACEATYMLPDQLEELAAYTHAMIGSTPLQEIEDYLHDRARNGKGVKGGHTIQDVTEAIFIIERDETEVLTGPLKGTYENYNDDIGDNDHDTYDNYDTDTYDDYDTDANEDWLDPDEEDKDSAEDPAGEDAAEPIEYNDDDDIYDNGTYWDPYYDDDYEDNPHPAPPMDSYYDDDYEDNPHPAPPTALEAAKTAAKQRAQELREMGAVVFSGFFQCLHCGEYGDGEFPHNWKTCAVCTPCRNCNKIHPGKGTSNCPDPDSNDYTKKPLVAAWAIGF